MRNSRILILICVFVLRLHSQTNILVDKKENRYLYKSGDNYFEYRPKSTADTTYKYIFEKNYVDKDKLNFTRLNSYKNLGKEKQKLDNSELEPVVFEFIEIKNKTKTGFTIRLKYWTESKDSAFFYHYYCIEIKTTPKNSRIKSDYCGTEI